MAENSNFLKIGFKLFLLFFCFWAFCFAQIFLGCSAGGQGEKWGWSRQVKIGQSLFFSTKHLLLSLPEQNQAARHSPPLHLGLRCLIEDAPSLTWDIHIARYVVHLACTVRILWMKSLKFHIYGVKCCNWCAFFYENLNILENFPRVKRLTNVMPGPSPESDCVKVLYWIIFRNWFR